MKEAYIVIDIGTGNVRVIVVQPDGTVLGEARDDIQYVRDPLYPDAIYFEPDSLWQQLIGLGKQALQQAGKVHIKAMTGTSQREGIVLLSKEGRSIVGLPNIDHRGREWESVIKDKSRVYQLTGRFPTSLFSALKLVGVRERRQEWWESCATFVSISDWVEFQLSGVIKYEPSQASETLMFDVAGNAWSDELLQVFQFDKKLLPSVMSAATVLGKIVPQQAALWGIAADAQIIAGGGDTQLAIKSTMPSVQDMVIVSGTTTPVVKLVDRYITDPEERTWTNRHVVDNEFVFEANAGVTGLNYQRLRQIFYPNESYEVIEQELAQHKNSGVRASLGSLVAGEKQPLLHGGFIFPAPVSHELSRSCFVWATMLDIGFSIAANYDLLRKIAGHDPDYVWACGGGLQSKTLRQILAGCIGKKVQVRAGYRQSSAVGGALICNEALGISENLLNKDIETELPGDHAHYAELYTQWRQTRDYFRNL